MSSRECIRFVVRGIGLVPFAYDLLERVDDANVRETLDWFEQHLDVPDRFNRTTSKGWYRRETRGLSWFRASALEHVARMRDLAEAVRRHGHEVHELRTERVGYVTYEDEVQVVAEPSRETPTT